MINVDRRGRGDSGDTAPYAVAREIEDLAAAIELAGGRAALYRSFVGRGPGVARRGQWFADHTPRAARAAVRRG